MNFVTKVKACWSAVTAFTKPGTMLLSIAGTVALGAAGIGGFTLYEQMYGPEAAGAVVSETESTECETELLAVLSTEEETQETEAVMETETETERELVAVKLVGSSIEKDLKIKIQNEEERNIAGEAFCITVTPDRKNAVSSVYQDHDSDGIIYITDIEGGDYLVALEEIEGYYTKETSVRVKVKERIEYVKVDVKDEIKSEAEVSPSEDAGTKTEIEVEEEIKDTVSWLDSKVTAAAVSADSIDKTPYLSGMAVLGANCDPVIVPKAQARAAVSFIYRNFFFVKSGTESIIEPVTEAPSTETVPVIPTTEIPSTETLPVTPPAETPPTEVPPAEPPVPETPDSSGNNGMEPLYATVAMPKNAQMFLSERTSANTLDLAIAVTDANETKVINEAGIIWSVSQDTTSDGGAGNGVLVTGNGKNARITSASSKKEGTAIVTAEIPYTNSLTGAVATVTLQCEVTVAKDTYDATIVLEDSAGDILYTDESCTKEATVADLMEQTVTTFYKNPTYQGWQTMNGKLYYYDESGKPVTGEQTISGMIYTFGSDGALAQNKTAAGIDVSKYQPNIDWETVKASGIEFVIIRVGYRGSSTGVLVEDPYFKQHIKGATQAGLKVGVYFFTQAVTKAEAVEEASMALELTQGYDLAYPIFIDTERASGNARANKLDKATRTECVEAFCKTIQNAGRKAGVYASKSWYNDQLNVSSLSNYTIWVAQYNTECTYTGHYDIWQYTENGSVPGISGKVDLNISYIN